MSGKERFGGLLISNFAEREKQHTRQKAYLMKDFQDFHSFQH